MYTLTEYGRAEVAFGRHQKEGGGNIVRVRTDKLDTENLASTIGKILHSSAYTITLEGECLLWVAAAPTEKQLEKIRKERGVLDVRAESP